VACHPKFQSDEKEDLKYDDPEKLMGSDIFV
jgi:hypothetical protein